MKIENFSSIIYLSNYLLKIIVGGVLLIQCAFDIEKPANSKINVSPYGCLEHNDISVVHFNYMHPEKTEIGYAGLDPKNLGTVSSLNLPGISTPKEFRITSARTCHFQSNQSAETFTVVPPTHERNSNNLFSNTENMRLCRFTTTQNRSDGYACGINFINQKAYNLLPHQLCKDTTINHLGPDANVSRLVEYAGIGGDNYGVREVILGTGKKTVNLLTTDMNKECSCEINNPLPGTEWAGSSAKCKLVSRLLN